MIPGITDSLIDDLIQSPKMVRAGRDYWNQGRVTKLKFDAEKAEITALVRGSEFEPYSVTIFIDDSDAFGFDTDCSCPVGIGCKHCAAVLYAAWKEQASGTAPSAPKPVSLPQIQTPTAKPVPLPQALASWIFESQRPALRSQTFDLVYVLTLRTLHPMKQAKGKAAFLPLPVTPHEMVAKIWLKNQPASNKKGWHEPTRHNISWAYDLTSTIDQWLVKQLTEYHGDIASGVLKGVVGVNWLEQAMATGRLLLGTPEGPALHWGQSKPAEFQWVTMPNAEQRLSLTGFPTTLTPVAYAPPLLLNGKTGTLHRVETIVEHFLAERLLRLPPVPPDAVSALADQWSKIAGKAVAPPALVNLTDLGVIAPIPVLTFRDEALDVFLPRRDRYSYSNKVKVPTASVRVSFDYRGTTVTHATDATLLLNATIDATIRFQRDVAAERKAFEQLAEHGLKPFNNFPEAHAKPAQAWDFTLQLGATPLHFADIIRNHVPALEATGWRIAYANNWSLSFVELEPDSLSFNVEPSGIDWFDISLGAMIDGNLVDILPLLRGLLDQFGEALLNHSAETLSIEITKGKLAQVPMEKIKPVLQMLLQFAAHDQTKTEKLRLPKRDLAALTDFESGTKTQIRWAGAEALRTLAKALTQLQLQPGKLPDTFNASLRPYQQQGFDWLQALHGAGFGGVLADDMGLGKTVQTLAHITTLKEAGLLKHPVMIVCPTSVLPNWQAELAKFAPTLTVLLWHGTARKTLEPEIGKQDVILTSYPLLVRDVDILKAQSFSLIIHDEAQMLKNPKTAGFKAAKQLTATQTLALTGTPVENQLTDAWSLMELVTPGLLGPLDHFNRTIAKPISRDNNAEAKRFLSRRLRPFMLRRTKDQVASDLPAKSEIPEWIDLTEAQRTQYESMRLLMQQKVREEIARVGLLRSHIVFLDALLKLRQICCDPRLLAGHTTAATNSAKLARLMEILPELIAEGRKVILFSQFTSMLDLIKPELAGRNITFTEIRGATKDRQTPVKSFQTGEVPLILVSLKAGGTGLNLTAADTVILYDPWWNPAVEAQAIDRAHRIGQTKPVFVHRLIARGTIEEKILSLQDRKRSLAETLWGEETANETSTKLTEEDVQFLLE